MLRRDLGIVPMTAIAVSAMLGVGIFFGPSLTAREFPDSRIVLGLWAAGGALALLGAWVFGRLAATVPESGGPYAYLRTAYGPLPAFLFAWTSLVVIEPTSLAVLATLFAGNLSYASPLTPRGLALMAVWSIAAVTFANVIGVKTGGRVQTVLSGAKVIIVLGLAGLLLASSASVGGADSDPSAAGGRWSIAVVGVLFAFGGWEYGGLASEEVRDGRRTVPRALVAATVIVTVLYLAAVAAYLAALGPEGVGAAAALAPEAMERALPGAGAALVAVAVAFSALGTLNALMLLGPRATFAAARDGLAPRALARVSARWGTPVAAILLQAVLSAVYMLTGLGERLAAYTVLGVALTIAPCAVALLVLRRRAGARATWPERAGALVVAGVFAWFVVWLVVESPGIALTGVAIVAAGVVPYALLARRAA